MFVVVVVGVVVVSFFVPVAIEMIVDESDDASNFYHLRVLVMVKQTMMLLMSLSLIHWVMLNLQDSTGGVDSQEQCLGYLRPANVYHRIIPSCVVFF